MSGRGHVAACGSTWHVAYLLFIMINEGDELDATAWHHDRRLRSIINTIVNNYEELGWRAGDATCLITVCH